MLKTIRVDVKYLTEQELIEKTKEIVDLSQKVYIVIETATISKKRHIQGMLEISDSKIDKKIRNIIINKLLNKQGSKEDYSFTTIKKYEEYMTYLSKGIDGKPPEIIYTKGISEEDIARYRDTAVMHQTKFKEHQDKKQSQNKARQYIEWFKENKLKQYYDLTKEEYDFDYGKICEDIMEFFNFKLMLFKNQIIEQYLHFTYNTVIREYQPKLFKRYQDKIKAKLMYDFVDFI